MNDAPHAPGHWSVPPKRVVVGVDFGAASARAAAVAGALAAAFDATLTAVHADRFEPPAYFTGEQMARLEVERRRAATTAMDEVRAFVGRVSAHPIEPVVLDESPVDALLHASADADLIVLGTHGRRGPSRWWLGSVAERVVRASRVPVLVTREDSGAVAAVFSEIVLLGEPGAETDDARRYAEALAQTFSGRVVEGGPLSACRGAQVEHASLLVLTAAPDAPRWRLTDIVSDAVATCGHPLLFVPLRSRKDSSS